MFGGANTYSKGIWKTRANGRERKRPLFDMILVGIHCFLHQHFQGTMLSMVGRLDFQGNVKIIVNVCLTFFCWYGMVVNSISQTYFSVWVHLAGR